MSAFPLQHWIKLCLQFHYLQTGFQSRISKLLGLTRNTNEPGARLELYAAGSLTEALAPALSGLVFTDATLQTMELIEQWEASSGGRVLSPFCPAYPPLLRTLNDPPALLFVLGDCGLLKLPQIALVGSRKPTIDGVRIAGEFAEQLVTFGYTITSGLAAGIDTASHKGALASGGNTIAVLGSGLTKIYPASNIALAQQVQQHGVLVSEYLPDTSARQWHFPQRNRIISGLAHGVLVVEAAQRSGSLITARLAAEQGREVFVVPGSIKSRQSQGCHKLIRQGAVLVENVEQLLQELGHLIAWEVQQLPAKTNDEHKCLSKKKQKICSFVGLVPVSADELLVQTGMTSDDLLQELVELEMLGLVTFSAGKYSRLL